MGVTAIIQARMTSSRLPGKVAMEVLGRPLLAYMVERVRAAGLVKRIVLATTANAEDDVIADLAAAMQTDVFRGSEENVLERFFGAAKRFGGDVFMRLTGDCPLIDPDLLDALIRFRERGEYDYASTCLEPTFPDGLDAEVFTMEALTETFENAELPSDLEHVTRYIYQRPTQFKLGGLRHGKDLSNMRWTVDEPEDFEFVRRVIETLYPKNRLFRMQDVLDLLGEHPELAKINNQYQRNEGLLKSLQMDERYLRARKSLQ